MKNMTIKIVKTLTGDIATIAFGLFVAYIYTVFFKN